MKFGLVPIKIIIILIEPKAKSKEDISKTKSLYSLSFFFQKYMIKHFNQIGYCSHTYNHIKNLSNYKTDLIFTSSVIT